MLEDFEIEIRMEEEQIQKAFSDLQFNPEGAFLYMGFLTNIGTVKLSFTDTHLIRTPNHYGQLFCPWEKKALSFSLNSSRVIRTRR